jgi:superfamily II RNA helicase
MTKIPKQVQKYEDSLNRFIPIMDTNSKKIANNNVDNFLFFSKYFRENKTNSKWLMNTICQQLHEKEMCPALFFVFSKKQCFNLAESITMRFNTDDEGRQIERDINYYLSKLDNTDDYKKTVQYYQILDLAKKGIAVHHSGLIPVFKEIIEMLFSKNHIKVLFATETFSVGLNMPTKTVVFSDIHKFDNGGKRLLYSHEFIQMSGRAGRRGLDTVGYVILLPQLLSDTIDRDDVLGLLNGKPQTLSSKFQINEKMILEYSQDVTSFVKRTMFNKEVEGEKQTIEQRLNKLPKYDIAKTEVWEEFEAINAKLTDIIQPAKATKKLLLKRKKEIEQLGDFSEIKSYKNHIHDIQKCMKDKDYIDNFIDIEIEHRYKFLEEKGYIMNNELTHKGLTSLHFKELDIIVGTEIVFSEFCLSLGDNDRKFVTLLTLITQGGGNEFFETPYPDITQYLESNFSIMLNRKDVYPVLDWYDQKHITHIIKEYKIFEGDLIKTVHRVINYIDELKDAYVYVNKLSIVDMLERIQKILEREIVSTESLYLKL